jgi:iron complex outermembrane receptor protein
VCAALLLNGVVVQGQQQPPASPPQDFTAISLEDLGTIKVPTVVGASKHEQEITQAPAVVSVLTQEDIKQYGYRTLGDLLRSVRGFYVTYDRSYDYTGLRGVNRPGDFGGRVLINIDGHRMNEPLFDSAFASTDFLLDMDLVERVEVIRGPGSSLYGNNAFFTVINVISRHGKDVNGLEASTSAGSYDTYTGRLTYGKQFANGLEVMVSGTYLDSAGQERVFIPEYRSVNKGFAEHLDGTEAKSCFASLTYGELSLEGGFIDRRKHAPTAQYFSLFNDPHFLNVDERAFAELKFAHEFAGNWSLQARVYYDHYLFDGIFPFNYSAPDPGPVTINRDRDPAEWTGGELLASWSPRDWLRATFGGEYRYDFELGLKNFDENPPATYVDSQRSGYSFGFYQQLEVTPVTNLTFNAGVREDYFSQFGDTINPRVALIYSPWQEGSFKFIYGQAFRAPNQYELNYIQPAFKANPNLQPETVRSYELAYEQGLPGRLRFTGSVFLNQTKGLIGQDFDAKDGKNFFANLDAVEASGVEAELEGRWKGGLRGRLSYTYADARNTATGQFLDNSPFHLGKANVAVPLWPEKIFAGLELQAMSSRKTGQGNRLAPFLVANATLYTRELVKNLEFSASLYNLFDRKYRDPLSSDYLEDTVVQEGRTFRLKLTYRF